MALSTTQINQAYIAILGRAAIGTESRVAGDASVSDVAASLIAAQANKGDKGIFATLADKALAEGNGLNNSDFVESLYTTLLNRDTENDAEGKAFWLNALNNGASREDLVDSFIKAVIAQKAANTQDYQNYAEQASVQSDNFVESLYTKLLGRSSDEAGKAYWSGLIADGASYAEVAANFAAAAASQGKGTEDGVAIANKLDVANYATTSITAFSKLATEQNIEEVKARIEQMIASTDKDSTAETIAESKKAIDSDANTFKAPGSVTFTRSDDKLGIDANGDYNTTKATDFNGSLNLDDATKGTIQAGDKVYGNPEFTNGNILTVNVTGTTTNKTLTLNNGLPGTITGVKNLEIKAGTAQVTGTIDAKFTNTVTINAGYTGQNNNENASTIIVNHTLDTYTAGAKADQLTVNANGKLANVNMGAGNDTIILAANGAKVKNIDAGAGTGDELKLATAAAAADYGIESITGVEVIRLTGANNATSGAQIKYDAIKDTNKAFSLASDSNGSGSLTIKAGNNKDIDVSKIVNGMYDKENGNLKDKVASLTIDGVVNNAKITLETPAESNSLVDTIVLAAGAKEVTITNFAKGTSGDATEGDHVKFATATVGNQAKSGDFTIGDIKSVKVTNKGYVTFYKDVKGSQTEDKLIAVNDILTAQKAIAGAVGDAVVSPNNVVAVNIGANAYLINVGANANNTDDDIVVKLIGVDASKGIEANQNSVNVLNA